MYHYHNNQTAASTGATVLLQQFYEKQNHQIEILFSSENRNKKKIQKLVEWHKCFLRQKHQCSSKMPLERSKIIDLKALKAV